jgi:hypothetical protein
MTITDLYMEKQAVKGFALKPFAYLGGAGTVYGGTKGAIMAPKGENKAKRAVKEGIFTGLSAGIIGGLAVGQAVKHGKKVIDYLEKIMKVV